MIQENQRVLVFSGHAADFCSRAGGTIMKFVEAGGTAQVFNLTYGERCESPALYKRNPKPSEQEVKEIRAGEIQRAADILGTSIESFDYGDSPLVIDADRKLHILEKFRAFRPDVVLTHWKNDIMHPDHAETTKAVLWACSYCGVGGIPTEADPCPKPALYCYETTSGTAPVSKFLPDVFVDITDVFDRKREALKQLAAQPALVRMYEVIGRYRALEATQTARISGCEFAEGFSKLGSHSAG
jgi:4-oxalomesaconate hydratase